MKQSKMTQKEGCGIGTTVSETSTSPQTPSLPDHPLTPSESENERRDDEWKTMLKMMMTATSPLLSIIVALKKL